MIAIAAMAQNRVIGFNGKIPWYLPEDFKHFKTTTSGGILIMGRKTFESLPGVLTNREHWVISRTKTFEQPNVKTFQCIKALPEDSRKQFIIGGEQIFRELIPQCEQIILSVVHQNPVGDTFFPPFEDEFIMDTITQKDGFDIQHYSRI